MCPLCHAVAVSTLRTGNEASHVTEKQVSRSLKNNLSKHELKSKKKSKQLIQKLCERPGPMNAFNCGHMNNV